MTTARAWLVSLVAAVVSGAMLMYSMPLGPLPGLAFLFLLPVLISVRESSFLRGFLMGVTTGLTAGWLSSTSLLAPAVMSEGTYAWNLLGFGFYGIVLGLIAGVWAEFRTFTWRKAVLLASLGVLFELLTFLKLPTHVALSQYQSPSIVWIASITGIWGVSWLIWFMHSLVFVKRAQYVGFVLILGLFTLTTVESDRRLQPMDPFNPMVDMPAKYLVGVVQSASNDAETLIELSRANTAETYLMVWPEMAVTSFDIPEIQDYAREWNDLVTTMHDDATPPHNAAYLFSREGQSLPYYKRKPFGAEANEIEAGTVPVVVGRGIGLNICFDSCYPWVMRETVLAGANLIALPTLDPISPNGFIQVGHAAFTPFRAAELGVPILRADTNADSMIVNGYGQIKARAGIGTEEVVLAYPLGRRATFYLRFGDWFLYLCVLVAAALILLDVRDRKRPPAPQKVPL